MRRHHLRIRATRWLAGACAGVGSLTCSLLAERAASAQANDSNPPMPNVMLLLDTSGSMELMMDGCNTDTGLVQTTATLPDGGVVFGGGGNCNGEIPCVAVDPNCAASQPYTGTPYCCTAADVLNPNPVSNPVGAPNGYCDGVTARTPNRWASLVQALAGSFLSSDQTQVNYSCLSLPRTAGSSFANEYSFQYANSPDPLGTVVQPYDLNYYLNYHRPVEPIFTGPGAGNVCAIGFQQGPTTLVGSASVGWNASDQGTGSSHELNPASGASDFTYAQIQGYEYSFTAPAFSATNPQAETMTPVASTAGPGGTYSNVYSNTCPMNQANDGLIEEGLNSIRFGMMSFDSDIQADTGIQGPASGDTAPRFDLTFTNALNGHLPNESPLTTQLNSYTAGLWSYFNGWETATAANNWNSGFHGLGPTLGRPAGCPETGVTVSYEVGARNPAAPPWEGRLMRFPTSATSSPAANNLQIMQAIDAMRPYGSNPIAGLMDDAKHYFWTDPQGPYARGTGLGTDSLAACRPQYIILFSHAAPNEDLQPYCQGGTGGTQGMCPYDYPQYIAKGLAAGSYDPTQGVINNESAAASGPPVKTFVVGFAPSSGFGDAGHTASCNDILVPTGTDPDSGATTYGVNYNTGSTVAPMKCGQPSGLNGGGVDSGTPGDPTYATCCALAEIAVMGGTNQPYFADNQTDISTALSAILAIILQSTSTRATPVVLPQTATSNQGTYASSLFVSAFYAAANAPWYGDVQRERYICPVPTSGPPYDLPNQDGPHGDDFQSNMITTQALPRHVMMVGPQPGSTGSATWVPSTTIRPYVKGPTDATAFDGYGTYDGTDFGFDYTPSNSDVLTNNGAIATDIPTTVFFPGKAANSTTECSEPGMVLWDTDCEDIALGWLLGAKNPPPFGGGHGWNTSLVGATSNAPPVTFPSRYYDLSTVTSGGKPHYPLGGVYHSTPAVVPPPSALIRDDSYQYFSEYMSAQYAKINNVSEARHTVLYTATTDGLLHAFGVDYNASDPQYTFTGSHDSSSNDGVSGVQNELWSFLPPAVMPNLMGAVGGGSTVLLDGAPVTKDTVYQRSAGGSYEDWHTTLVAGFGQAQGGYYALEVTDPNFNNRYLGGSSTTGVNQFGPIAHTGGNTEVPPSVAQGGYMNTPQSTGALALPSGGSSAFPNGFMPQGPHFLWQLLDSSLFANGGGTPAITTVSFCADGNGEPTYAPCTTPTEVGVAILPGGTATPGTGACPRVTCTNGVGTCTAGTSKISDASPPTGAPGPAFRLNGTVRQWNPQGCPGWNTATTPNQPINPVPGRSLTIVRLDTGEVLRSFAVLTDLPLSHPLYGASGGTPSFIKNATTNYTYAGRITQAEFDSPVSGTPVVFPADVGSIAQRVFVGDEDGTIWRLNVSDHNPNNWYVEPFLDAYANDSNITATNASDRAPIVGAPSVSVGRTGNLVLNFGTGDVNFIGLTTNQNYVISVSEVPPQAVGMTGSSHLYAEVNWYFPFPTSGGTPTGEMMTGPSQVFDTTYYFASYAPTTQAGSTNTCAAGSAAIWAMDYVNAADSNGNLVTGPSTYSNGGVFKLPPSTSGAVCDGLQPATSGAKDWPCVSSGAAIIPGVTITATQACATPTSAFSTTTGGATLGLAPGSSITPPSYTLSALEGTGTPSGPNATGGAAVAQVNIAVSVRTTPLIDSWASIVE
jgi:type IV pilus assembly protein PilY1